MNERKVYAAAHSCGVLTDPELGELEELYDFRNIVIHRFVLSGVTYAEIAPRLDRYESIYERISEQLRIIEQPDSVDLSDEEVRRMRERVARKLGPSQDPEIL
jgi:hypothetical protein